MSRSVSYYNHNNSSNINLNRESSLSMASEVSSSWFSDPDWHN